MKDKMRKKTQRYINKCVHALNKNIADDYLWRGRFVARQTDAVWEKFEDSSGGTLGVEIMLRDKKTNQTRYIVVDNYDITWKLWHFMNDFIMTDCEVWSDREAVYSDKTDYRKVR